jgi:hypothetical protein
MKPNSVGLEDLSDDDEPPRATPPPRRFRFHGYRGVIFIVIVIVGLGLGLYVATRSSESLLTADEIERLEKKAAGTATDLQPASGKD